MQSATKRASLVSTTTVERGCSLALRYTASTSHISRWKTAGNSDSHCTFLMPEMPAASSLLSLCPSQVLSSEEDSRMKSTSRVFSSKELGQISRTVSSCSM